jgi:hypothetical protein
LELINKFSQIATYKKIVLFFCYGLWSFETWSYYIGEANLELLILLLQPLGCWDYSISLQPANSKIFYTNNELVEKEIKKLSQ